MIERIKYYERQLNTNNKMKSMSPLTEIEHPLVIDVLLGAIQSDTISKSRRVYLYNALLTHNVPRTYEVIIQAFITSYRYNTLILKQIHKINDKRIVDTLKNTLQNLEDIPRLWNERIVRESMQALAKLAPQEAIPLLKNMIESYPFISEENPFPKKRYGLFALDTLREIDDPSVCEIVHKWDSALTKHVNFHIDDGFFQLNQKRTRRIPHQIQTHPDLIQHILKQLQSDTSTIKSSNIMFLIKILKDATVSEKIKSKILETFCQLAGQSEEMGLRNQIFRFLVKYNDPRLLDLALQSLDNPDLSSQAVQILTNLEYRDAVDKVIPMVREKARLPDQYYPFIHYLGFAGTAHAESKLRSLLLDHNTDTRFISKILNALAQIACYRDSAFETICLMLDHPEDFVRHQAIVALGKVGERAMTILITFLRDDERYIIKALTAMSSETFRDALPYVTPLLVHTNQRVRRIAHRTILAFQSESAFAVLNAVESQPYD